MSLAQALIRRPSGDPGRRRRGGHAAGGSWKAWRFRLPPDEVRRDREPLRARRGTAQAEDLCFAGHTDVVLVGERRGLRDPGRSRPRSRTGSSTSRGAVDMKSTPLAAFVAAVSKIPEHAGSISFLITGDEEGRGRGRHGQGRRGPGGRGRGHRPSASSAGRASASLLGDTVKIGRRGSINAWIAVDEETGCTSPIRTGRPTRSR
ncbi:M20/M25/M40 family metallo-hydrolase [Caulobacter segnis]